MDALCLDADMGHPDMSFEQVIAALQVGARKRLDDCPGTRTKNGGHYFQKDRNTMLWHCVNCTETRGKDGKPTEVQKKALD